MRKGFRASREPRRASKHLEAKGAMAGLLALLLLALWPGQSEGTKVLPVRALTFHPLSLPGGAALRTVAGNEAAPEPPRGSPRRC